MAVRNNKDIALGVIRVFEARTLVFVSDFVDQSVKAANDVLGGFSTGTSVGPNIPRPLAPLSSLLADLLARQPLIVPVVPLSNRLRNFNLGLGPDRLLVFRLLLFTPRHPSSTAKLEQL
eukprot:Transcript_30296.p2 GENE.Transcript_30296~~Transcript_30296.p2  ORF type:complete len:119 (+),score=8.87 Transcript_30296:3-359(+)